MTWHIQSQQQLASIVIAVNSFKVIRQYKYNSWMNAGEICLRHSSSLRRKSMLWIHHIRMNSSSKLAQFEWIHKLWYIASCPTVKDLIHGIQWITVVGRVFLSRLRLHFKLTDSVIRHYCQQLVYRYATIKYTPTSRSCIAHLNRHKRCRNAQANIVGDGQILWDLWMQRK